MKTEFRTGVQSNVDMIRKGVEYICMIDSESKRAPKKKTSRENRENYGEKGGNCGKRIKD